MLHYKLTSNALDLALQNKEAFKGNSKGYNDFIEFISKGKVDLLNQNNTAKYRSPEELVEREFLFTSEKCRNYVDTISCKDIRQGES